MGAEQRGKGQCTEVRVSCSSRDAEIRDEASTRHDGGEEGGVGVEKRNELQRGLEGVVTRRTFVSICMLGE